ncbi:MAG: DUF5685 family protein [Tissierellia bacterium]|nr:DUF5685 family protein [Tissierellia bacterium]MDD4780167.1 DUF5685 family protein [Tissierellia bacterium]
MFGYVTINKMELKFKEYYSYKGYYCGLCKTLKNKYNNVSRMTLNYDMTFLILLLSSLYEVNNVSYNSRCMVHPVKKQLIIHNEITEYAAGINIILSYFNLKDNWEDEKDGKSFLLSKILKKQFTKASSQLVEKSNNIKLRLQNLSDLEKLNSSDIDAVSNEFGHLMEEIILYKVDVWEETLRKIGFFLGKFIYLLDAYEDMEKDKRNKSYNPFNNLNIDDIDSYAMEALNLNLAFLSEEIEKLPLIQDKGIIDNIVYSGMMSKIKITRDKKGEIK